MVMIKETNPNNRILIGIGHKARQGKDTAADYLSKKYGAVIIHFADALYKECEHAEILYKEASSSLWLKPPGEPYFHYPRPPQAFVEWMCEKGERKSGLPFDADIIFGGMKKKDGVLLQFWGTEFRRKCFAWDYWVDKVRAYIDTHQESDFIVPDTRFINEAKMIKEMGGALWKIDRTGYVADDRDPNHPSEVELNGWEFDEVIVNDGTIAELHQHVDRLYQKIKGIEESLNSRSETGIRKGT